ncbi:hypothetical protein C922_04970 [Plasmodium inui San Antonio 1]|uniref:PPM-type phosphatase domain-containing protein n=1 Tax=Plasmodium inui San Antonio 1 TaxID=1237626 RepID=W7A6A3_9APIC|nr:hypothetical protein C922_04970 [Plasmodium inui San Antonio 1]EUD64624.1 hypothetical protein C922_04970 [Plasmodium inui San Antonio 1]
MITRDKDESEVEEEGGDNSFRGGRDGERNGLSYNGSSGGEVQMVVPVGDATYEKIKEDKAERTRKGEDASMRMDIEDYTDKEAHPEQRLLTEDPLEEVAPFQGGNKAHVKNEQMESINFKAIKVVPGGEEKRLSGGAYGYVSDENGTSGRGQNGAVTPGGAANRAGAVNQAGAANCSDVPEDLIILPADEIGDRRRRRVNSSGEGLYTDEDKEGQDNHMMKRGFQKWHNENIMGKVAEKSCNNIMDDTSNDFTVIDAPDDTALERGAQNRGSHKRSKPLFDDPSVKQEGEKKMKKGQEETADYGVVRGKAGNQTKVRTKKEPRGRAWRAAKKEDVAKEGDTENVERTTSGDPPRGPSRKDNFHLYCQNYNKIFGDAGDRDVSKCETGGMMSSTRDAPSGDTDSGNTRSENTRSDPIHPLDSRTLAKQKDEESWKNQLSEIWSIIYDTNGDGNPVNGKNQLRVNNRKNKIIYPSIYKGDKKEWFRAKKEGEWLVHKLCDWFYNEKEKLYFNIKTEGIYYVKDGSFLKIESSFDERGGDSGSGNRSDSRRGSFSENVHEEGFSYEFHSDDTLLNKKGKTTNGDGRNLSANVSDMVSDQSVPVEVSVSIEDNGSMRSSSSRVISRSSSGDAGAEADSGSSNLRSDKTEQGNGSADSGSPGSGSPDNRSLDRRRPNRDNGEGNDETVEEFSMVLEDDLVCGTYSQKGDHSRCENEDLYVTKEILDLNNVSESDGLCFFSGVFDGHGGSNCARYVMKHLKTNLIAKFRQSFLITCKKQSKEKESKPNDFSAEIRALYDSCIKGFDMTDKNYIELSKKYHYKDGCTACIVLIYGPDDDGSLKVLCANCGDSGGLICHDRKPVKLSVMHKPDLQEERMRIIKCGGIIANIKGINRIITKHKVKGQTVREKTYLALSTSRSFGDILYKVPKKIVLCKPFISVYTIDFDMDSFLVLATDGILNVLTDKEIIDIVWRNIHRKPEEAAEEVVHEASRRGSTDDKTCTVIFFYWRKDIFRGKSEDASMDAPPREESPGEDINMFSEVF